MATVNYTIKPFHPGQAHERDNGRGESAHEAQSPHKALSRSAEANACPDVSLTDSPVPTMKRLALDRGAEWCRILIEARKPDAHGNSLLDRFSLEEVAKIVGTTDSTLCRLVNRFGKIQLHELTPERIAPVKGGGRECDWAFLLKNEQFKKKLLELYVATINASSAQAANDRRTADISRTLMHFAYEPECPEKLKVRLAEGYQPVPFINFLRAYVTPEVEMGIRGRKHAQLYGPSARRDMTFRLPDGRRGEVPAAWTLSMDDMSENHPFFVEHQGETILSRQGLYSIFYKHKFWQGVDLVARIKESYRAEDILRAFYGICQAVGGVPQYVEFEQGIWKSKMISGWKRDGDFLIEETVARPGMAQSEMDTIAAGLGLCGVTVKYKYSAHNKHVETHFNPLQKDIAITARQFQHIGRYAGEYELPGKQLRRVRAESHQPGELHFATQAQLADCIAEAMHRSRQQASDVDGMTREEAHWADIAKVGFLPITDRLFAACLPGKMKKTTLRGGYIQVELNGVEYQFRNQDDTKLQRLGDGYELFYKMDETNPNAGIAVFNRTSQSNSANFQGWQPGEFMFHVARELPGPKFDVITAPAGVELTTVEERYGRGAVDQGDTGLRKAKGFVATQTRHAPKPGQIAIRSATARDGRGNVVEVSNQAVPASTAADAPAATQRVGNAPAASLPPRATTAKQEALPYSLRKALREQRDVASPETETTTQNASI